MPARIDSTSVSKGSPEHISALLEWTGTDVVTWKLTTEAGTVLQQGSGTSRSVSGLPGEQVTWLLTGTDAQSGFETTEITYVFPALPTPYGLSVRSTSVTSGSGSAVLEWGAVPGATSYEVANTSAGYAVVKTSATATATVTGMSVGRDYTYAVRARYSTAASPWSLPIRTAAHPPATLLGSGTTILQPLAASCWDGSAWDGGDEVQVGGDEYEGTGWLYAAYGEQTLRDLAQVRVVAASLYVPRTLAWQWPVMPVLSMHTNAALGAGAPSEAHASIMLEELDRGEDAWIDIPSSWVEAMLADTEVHGLVLGGTMQQPMMVRAKPDSSEQATMSLRIDYEGE